MWLRVVVAIILLQLPAAAFAQTEKRFALLIGNQSYSGEVGRLANPHNDVALLDKTLKSLRFEVTTVRDAGLGGLHQAVNAYARRVQAAGPNAVGFFYYSGHGAADNGVNYLIPVDVKTTDTGDLWDQSLRLTEITRKLKAEAGNASHFVVFDACRNSLKLTRPGTRSLVQSKGFVPVAQESGMLIAYATAEGELAFDVGAEAGPYAKTLAEELVKPGVEAVTMFRTVQIRVKQQIGQDPWLTFPSLPPVYLAGLALPSPGAGPTTGTPTTYEQQTELEIWASVKDSKDPDVLKLYLDRYPKGAFADLAKLMIAQAKREADARQADAAKRAAEAQRIEAEQKARAAENSRQQDQLRQALEEARLAREASKAAERDRLAAEKAAQEAREALKSLQTAKAAPPPTPVPSRTPAPSPTPSSTSSGQQAAWVKLCEKQTATQKTKDGRDEKKDLNICLTHHERLDGNSGMVLVSAAVRQVEGQDKQAFMVMVPLGMMVQPGMRVTLYPKDLWDKAQKNEKVDESKLKPLSLAYTLCHPAGCTAETEATPELLNDLKKGGGLMVFAINAAGAPAAFPVPLVGFEQSYLGAPVDSKKYAEQRKALMEKIAADKQRK
jgi:invasion protein IalB